MSDDSKTSASTQALPSWAQAWKDKIGNYEMGDDASQRMTELLGDPNDSNNAARIALYERSDKKAEALITESESNTARTDFIDYVGKRFTKLQNQKSFLDKPITMEALLGKKGLELYKSACLEENNTREFREAVFLSSTTSLDGPKWSDKLVLWVGGPSASGKSFGTEGLLNTLNDPANPALSRVENSTRNDKNHVVSIDGGKEREMSQMRQLVLQIALASGYSGVKDLESHSKNIKTKGFVQKAVLETDLNMAIPATFTSKPGKQEKLMKKFAETKTEAEAEAERREIKQIYAQVRGVPSVKREDKEVNGLEQFRQSVQKMGMKRAFRLVPPEEDASINALIKPNNRKIGVESKNYDGSVFDYGMKQSNEMREKFKAICEKNNIPFKDHYYEITNDLLFIKKDSKGEWVECTEEDAFNSKDIVLSNSRAFDAYKKNIDDANAPKNLDPNDFSKEMYVNFNEDKRIWEEVKADNKRDLPEGTITMSVAAWKKILLLNKHNDTKEDFADFIKQQIKNSDFNIKYYSGALISQGGHEGREEDQKDLNEEKISKLNAAYRALKGEKKTDKSVAEPAVAAATQPDIAPVRSASMSVGALPIATQPVVDVAPPVLNRSASVSARALDKDPKLDKIDKTKSTGLFTKLARSASAVVQRKKPVHSDSSDILSKNPLFTPLSQSDSASLNSSLDSLSTSSSSLGSDIESTLPLPTPPENIASQDSDDEFSALGKSMPPLPKIPVQPTEVLPPLPDTPVNLTQNVSLPSPPLPLNPEEALMKQLASRLGAPPRPLRTDLGETIPGQIRHNKSAGEAALDASARPIPRALSVLGQAVKRPMPPSPVPIEAQVNAQNPSSTAPKRPPPPPPGSNVENTPIKPNSAGQEALAVHSAPVLGAMGPKKGGRTRVFGTVEELQQKASQVRDLLKQPGPMEGQVPENKGSNELGTRKNGLK